MSKRFLSRLVAAFIALASLLMVSAGSYASCVASPNANLAGSWSTLPDWNYMGSPMMAITISYTPPTSRRIRRCETVRERGGFPFYGIVEYERCTITRECTGGGFYGSSIRWWNFSINHISGDAESVGVEVGEWLRFEVEEYAGFYAGESDPIRIWVRMGSNNNTIDFVRDIAPFGDEFAWVELYRD